MSVLYTYSSMHEYDEVFSFLQQKKLRKEEKISLHSMFIFEQSWLK